MVTARCGLCLGFALLIPGLTVAFAAGPMHAERGLLPAPFGWREVLAVQLLATLPLGWLVAGWLRSKVASVVVPILAGAGVSMLVYAIGPALGAMLDAAQAGWIARVLVRAGLCLALQIPWLWLAGQGVSSRAGLHLPPAVIVLAAVLLPLAHTGYVIDRQTRRATDAAHEQHLIALHDIATRLCDLGSLDPIAGVPPRQARQQALHTLVSLRQETSAPLDPSASVPTRIDRARQLGILGRFEEAVQLMEPLQQTDAEAALLLALLYQKQERHADGDRVYREWLDRGEVPRAGRTEWLTRAYDGLAFNARARKRFREAQALYETALERLPEARAHFHFQLGRHFHQAGRPAEASTHLARAAELDAPRFGAAAASLLQELRQHTPGCVLDSRYRAK